jgi:hypothetical protein
MDGNHSNIEAKSSDFTIQDFLIQHKNFSSSNIFQVNHLDGENKSLFKNFNRIDLTSKINHEVQQIYFTDIYSSCCIIVPSSLKAIPKCYFFYNPRKSKEEEGDFSFDDQIPLQRFSLQSITLVFISKSMK